MSDIPSYADIEWAARHASSEGLLIKLWQTKRGYSWLWQHAESGLQFDGETTAHSKPVALVFALMEIPTIMH